MNSITLTECGIKVAVEGHDEQTVSAIFETLFLFKKTPSQREQIQRVIRELSNANVKHPEFPQEMGKALAIVTEEYLETVRAVNDGEPVERIREELAHTAVTCIRAMVNIGELKNEA